MMAVAILLVTVREREYSPSLTLYFYDTYRRWCGHAPEAVCVCGVSNEYASADALPEPQLLARQNCPLSYKLHATILLQLGQSRRRRGVKKLS